MKHLIPILALVAFAGCTKTYEVDFGDIENSDRFIRYTTTDNKPLTDGSYSGDYVDIWQNGYGYLLFINEPLTFVPSGVFTGKPTLSGIEIPESVTFIANEAFSDCTGLTSITIPESVTTIYSSAFAHCSGLQKITIPESVREIGSYAFFYCESLTSIIIPSVKEIASCAFCGCTGLTSITLPEGVTSIGEYAFAYCRGLTSVTVYGTKPPMLDNDVFVNSNASNCTLYVPAESIDLYGKTKGWEDFGKILPIE